MKKIITKTGWFVSDPDPKSDQLSDSAWKQNIIRKGARGDRLVMVFYLSGKPIKRKNYYSKIKITY